MNFKNKLQKYGKENVKIHYGNTLEKKFTFNVYEIDLQNDIDNKVIKENILDFQKRYPKSNRSNINAWHSSYFTNHIDTNFNNIISVVEEKCNNVINVSGFSKLKVLESWIAIYKLGDNAGKHDHYPSVFNAVYYVQTTPNSSPLILQNGLEIVPIEGTLVVFPGYVEHYVPPSNEINDRIIMAFNLTFY